MLQGMVQSAEYIYNKIKSEDLLGLAYNSRPELGTTKYPVVCTGHSLGAGTAALLAILLRDREYPDVTCYAFSPPGGLIRYCITFYQKFYACKVNLQRTFISRSLSLMCSNGWCSYGSRSKCLLTL